MSESESISSFNPFGDSIFQGLADHLQDAIHLLDPHLETVYWNQAAEDITGYARAEVLGRECHKNILLDLGEEGLHLCKDNCPVLQVFKDGQFREQEAYIQHKDGYRLPVRMRLMPVLGEGNVVTAVVESFQESFPRVALPLKQSDLQRMDLLDALTGSGNRRFLEMHLRTRLEEMKAFGVAFGILYIDIDDLETINASHGTVVGNKVIRMISQTLASNIRFFEVVGRWEGQEFLAVLLNVDSTKLDLVGNKLRLLVEQSHLSEEDHFIKTTISAGATVARTSDSPESLVIRAKELTAHSKWCGKNRVSLKLPEP
jgi:diguanylate cyclase (GGDEF)-like protein/PAS domain S-box-containing protein